MKLIKFLPHCLIIALLAASVQIFQQLAGGNYFPGWIVFISWALYFLAGGTLSGGGKSIAGWIAGILAAAGIILLGGWLVSFKGLMADAGFPIAVGVIAFVVILFEKVKFLDYIPAWFLAAGSLFALSNMAGQNDLWVNMLIVLGAGAAGQLYGWVTVFLRGLYSKKVS